MVLLVCLINLLFWSNFFFTQELLSRDFRCLFLSQAGWHLTNKWFETQNRIAKVEVVGSPSVESRWASRLKEVFLSVDKLKPILVIVLWLDSWLENRVNRYFQHIIDHLGDKLNHVFVWCAEKRICIDLD